jgi:hypothetical protein
MKKFKLALILIAIFPLISVAQVEKDFTKTIEKLKYKQQPCLALAASKFFFG